MESPQREIEELKQRVTALTEENKELREINRKLGQMLNRTQIMLLVMGVEPEEVHPIMRSIVMDTLIHRLSRAVSRCSFNLSLARRVYNILVNRAGITSISQLRVIIPLVGEKKFIEEINGLGTKSRQIIHEAIVIDREENRRILDRRRRKPIRRQ